MYNLLYIINCALQTVFSQIKAIKKTHIQKFEFIKNKFNIEKTSYTCQLQRIDKDNTFQILTRFLTLRLQILT
jgi:hypothetical protein